jgi:radical SAM protein with 4Fe4S-binding SPASM domain
MAQFDKALTKNLIFEVTPDCTHACLHCYNPWKSVPECYPHSLSPEQTLELLHKILSETDAELITLTGGEPLLRPDLLAIIRVVRSRGIRINLITNGYLLQGNLLEDLIQQDISLYELPLLSSQREIHDRLSQTPGAFDRVTEAIADLKLHEQRVVGVFVATAHNLHTLAETIELAVALGVDAFMFNRFNPGGAGWHHFATLQAGLADLRSALALANRLASAYALPISCSIAMPPCLFETSEYPHLSFGFCGAGTSRAYFTFDAAGNLRPCNHSPRILGNLLEHSLAELVASPSMSDFLQAAPSLCRNCHYERLCMGGCKAAAESCYRDVRLPDPFLERFKDQVRIPQSG